MKSNKQIACHLSFRFWDRFYTVELKWKTVTSGHPAIRIFNSAESSGGTMYLTDDGVAETQAIGANNNSVYQITRNSELKLPTSFWKGLSTKNPFKYLLFEAIDEGAGQLVAVMQDSTGKIICESPGVWLDLKNIKKLYIRSNAPELYAGDPADVTEDTIIFVHGWRMSPDRYVNDSETMYKRLWHRGFKGRFATFRWNTYYSDNFEWTEKEAGQFIDSFLARYNPSEKIAWESGVALKTFVSELPGKQKHLCAHSMGNIVTGSALLAGMNVTNYVLMQAAVPSACYDEGDHIKEKEPYPHTVKLFNFFGSREISINVWDKLTPDDDDDEATRALAYRGRLKDISANVSGKIISFYLPKDKATYFAWEVNNKITKPFTVETLSIAPGPKYNYDRSNLSGQKLYKFLSLKDESFHIERYLVSPQDNFEAMARACSTWGKAAGASDKVGGAIEDKVNLGRDVFQLPGEKLGEGFGDEHSGQFTARIQDLKTFYDTLLTKLNLTTYP